MTRGRIFGLLLIAAAAFCAAGNTARAQVTTAPVIKAKAVKTQALKPTKTNFEVLHMMSTAIQVRNPANVKEIHTFTYSDQIRDKMQTLLNQGGYQYGDKILIQYMPGTEVALKIKGKPSKPA